MLDRTECMLITGDSLFDAIPTADDTLIWSATNFNILARLHSPWQVIPLYGGFIFVFHQFKPFINSSQITTTVQAQAYS